MKKKIFIVISIALILFLGLFLRAYRLDQNIPALYADETGGHYFMQKEIVGGKLSPLSLINYATFSFTWFLGLNPLGVRLPSALYGSFIGVGMFLFANVISKKNLTISIISGLLGALLPWGFMISRIGHTHVPIISLFIILYITLLIRANKIRDYLVCLIPLLIATYYYSSMVVITPIALLLTFYLSLKSVDKKYLKIYSLSFFSLLIMIGVFLSIKFQVFNPQGRGLDLAIWKDVNVTADANLYRGFARTSSPTIFSFGMDTEKLANKIVYNYPISIINIFTRNYLSFFSPDFLFLKGDTILRHSTGMVGEFFPFLLPFMLIGGYLFFKQETAKNKLIFLTWILISPLPAAITKDGASYLLRVITLMPFLTYFCALGLYSSLNFFKNKFVKYSLVLVTVLLGLYSTYYFYFGYFHAYPAYSVDAWEFGFKEVADFTKENNFQNTLITWDDSYPVRHYCFWLNLPYEECKNENIFIKSQVGSSTLFKPLDYLYFSIANPEDLKQILSQEKIRYLIVSKQQTEKYSSITKGMTLVKDIIDPAGNKSFSIYLEK